MKPVLVKRLVFAVLSAGLGFGFSQSVSAADSEQTGPMPASQANKAAADPIPFSELGAKATAVSKGAGTGIAETPEGACLHADHQRLSGTVTREGLWLDSTEQGGGRLRMMASAVGRIDSQLSSISSKRLLLLAVWLWVKIPSLSPGRD